MKDDEQQAICFILNDVVTTLSDAPPDMTLLQYLRQKAGLTGTKEGCAEGDCGACTVIVGRLEQGELRVEAINACIALLPALDGRQIVTVEHLAHTGLLHPVQQALIDCHGSQCGFCTPGFVMALAALLHNEEALDDEAIHDAIAGNLCRCTGYRPIVEAARQAVSAPRAQRQMVFDRQALESLQREEAFVYAQEDVRYCAPVTAAELDRMLAQDPAATLLTGGTDVGLWITKLHRKLATIIYIGNVRELQQIKVTPEGVEIGAAVTIARAFDVLAAYEDSMGELLQRFASAQIRNTGTVVGNIANGSPIGDMAPPLMALGAEIILRSETGSRRIRLEDYFIAYGRQDRQPGEYVEKLIVPPSVPESLFRVYKVSKRFDQDISAVCGAFFLERDEDGLIHTARLAYGGMAGTPQRAGGAESCLIGQKWDEQAVRQAMARMVDDFTPLTDMRASAHYRQEVAQNLLYRFYLETATEAGEMRIYRYGH